MILSAAGILIPAHGVDTQRREWAIAIGIAEAKSSGEKGFCSGSPSSFIRFMFRPLRRYYRHLARSGQMKMGDTQCDRRYVAHNDPVARFFHKQLAPILAEFAGEPIKPSYVYVASYREGAILKKHTDREQCEFSVTLNIDYAPEPSVATAWPLRLHSGAGATIVFQAIGDALLYRGCQVAHSRTALPAGHSSTSIFFHYVRETFAGDLNQCERSAETLLPHRAKRAS